MSKPTPTSPKRSTPSKPPAGKPRWQPHPYMKRAVRFLLEHAAAGLFLDPGLGKTSITLAAIKVLLTKGLIRSALVVAPLRPATSTWPNEVAKWADFASLDLVVLHGDRMAQLAAEQHDIYVINYEGLSKLFVREKVNKLWANKLTPMGKQLLGKADLLVWDELQKMKNPTSKRFELVKPWLRKFARVWGLTGSPAANGLEDLFGQIYMLDEGHALGAYITHYRRAYFDQIGPGFHTWVLRPGADVEIYRKLKPLVLRMEAEDYLTLPAQIGHTVSIDLPAKARAVYDKLEADFLAILDGGELITAPNAATAAGKCRQVCAGAIYLHDFDPVTGVPRRRSGKDAWTLVHDEKLDALEELVDELQGNQLLVAYEFNHDLDRLRERFPKAEWVGGGVSAEKSRQIEARWNAGKIPLLLGHPASIGHGLNLQGSHAAHIAWFSLTWDFELYDQMNRRLRRQGNGAEHIHVYAFVVKDSVEESVAFALRRKERTQKALLDALKKRSRLD